MECTNPQCTGSYVVATPGTPVGESHKPDMELITVLETDIEYLPGIEYPPGDTTLTKYLVQCPYCKMVGVDYV